MYMLTFDANDGAAFPGYGFGVASTLANNGPIVTEFDVDGHNDQSTMFGKTTINDGNWHLIVATYTPDLTFGSSDSVGKIYVDGVLDDTANTMAQLESPTAAPSNTLKNPLAEYIGTDDNGAGSAFNGMFCDLRFYSGALSASQVSAMYAPATRWQLYTSGPSFSVSGFPTTDTAGTAGTVTVTALNANGTVNTGYTGTVQISSSDAQAVLPAAASLTNGTGTFTVTLKTAGTQSITATDSNNVTGAESGITVQPAAASQVVFTQVPGSATAGQSLSTTRAAIEDAYGNIETGDTTDSVTVSVNTGPSSELGGTLKATVAGGVATFSNLVLNVSGSYTLAALANLSAGGTLGPADSSAITVNSPVQLQLGAITFNSSTGLYSETVTFTNNGSSTLTGPMSLALTGLPAGVVLTDKTGTTNGLPYIRFLTSGQRLRRSQSVTVTLTFSAPNAGSITFGTEVIVGL